MTLRFTYRVRLNISTLVCNKSLGRKELENIAGWCCANNLLINPDKTKLVLFGTRQLVSKLPDVTVSFLGQQLCPVLSAKDLGVTLDSGLTFNNHISSLSSSLLSSLCQISRVRHLFSKEVLYITINSVVFSKLFYCSAVWAGINRTSINYNSCRTLLPVY